MINKKKLTILASLAVLGVGAYLVTTGPESTPEAAQVKNPLSQLSKVIVSKPLPALVVTERSPASVRFINRPSPVWKDRLISSLRVQGGDNLRNVQVKKERSLIWTRDSNPLSAESVVITLQNKQGEESSFRAIVDSQSGMVLESWDKPISDPADVRAGFHIKLDERYSN